MTTRYRVEYALKTHRRDEFIEWLKGLLAVPFVLHAGPISLSKSGNDSRSAAEARRRYAEIFHDVEKLIENQIYHDRAQTSDHARLRQLVPSVSQFFTKLPLERAFYVQDELRSMSFRRLVAPSFNDIRIILNTAQAMSLADGKLPLKLVTFDGDVTLYDDGMSLEIDSPVIAPLINLLSRNVFVGIVTAAGYSEKSGEMYAKRLHGLLKSITVSRVLTLEQKTNLLVMGGESNYMFRYNPEEEQLQWVEPSKWVCEETINWKESDINDVLDIAESVLAQMKARMNLPAQIIRKYRGVGLVPLPGCRLGREQLEEVVLTAQQCIEVAESAKKIEFCAFNGGADVWVDIGNKRLGVKALQMYLGDIMGQQTLHVGDQFASLGANDFKARLAACTAWIASPSETVDCINELCILGYL
ncbi:IMP-specific 5'-nucleotidase 1 [Nadsonia fulvescens var. elongata DSM 6958]|uniref:IMP-specific 5'-nucleotidase 1 n=1 Tax=Nadsonia fulvescens var. elongata DSM 6958 TaxID=857566 RepID=A0A1E3PSH4_9ASCO|nr:IMP-specific 5'-nucleotidase 1 [Nadsonia fulvescens var. elongata DSM 6958]